MGDRKWFRGEQLMCDEGLDTVAGRAAMRGAEGWGVAGEAGCAVRDHAARPYPNPLMSRVFCGFPAAELLRQQVS